MLNFCSPPEDDRLPEAPGGFCWWYVDLVDERGDGAVLIWGFALPFLEPPTALPAAERPFVNLAIYVQGRCTGYWLVELDPREVTPIDGGWQMGPSRFVTRRGPTVTVQADLVLPVPGGTAPIVAHLQVTGPAAIGAPPPTGPHRWSPVIGAGSGHLELSNDLRLAGRAYHDRNVSDVPLASLGIREWAWGRVAEPGGDRVHYVLWPEAGTPLVLAVHLGEDGTVRWIEGTCEEGGGSRGNWGLRVPRMMILSDPSGARYEVSTPRLVDDAPFYARFPLMTPNGRGWGERVRPGGIGRWWMRPFVGMRVVGPSRSSLWTPLFVGTEQDRLRRLGRWWVG